MKRGSGIVITFLFLCFECMGQEGLAPLKWNPLLSGKSNAALPAKKGTALLPLPFFEDFTDRSMYPNGAQWTDSNVYINNTMGVNPISRGVATFDALNKKGRPYDTITATVVNYADSLTSQAFDLSIHSPSDNIYLSFFYQPQGYGFSPENGDSLMLFFRKKAGGWTKVWSKEGTSLQPFQQVILPVTDTSYLFGDFQFRFVNKASINTNDDVWNVDYIRMGVNRSMNDTAVNDLAFTIDPTYLLNDYTYMPYRQYLANAASERAAQFSAVIWNHYSTNGTVNYGYDARELTTGAFLSSGTGTSNIAAYTTQQISFPVYSAAPTAPATNSRMVFQNKFFLQSGNPNETKANDTIIRDQIFDNYLAYDDGTAEKSYYLNLFPTLPGKVAIEYHLNQPDTLQGLAVYFGQQVPVATGKLFSIIAYQTLAGINGSTQDSIIARQDLLSPLYTDTINHFSVYKFSNPVVVANGAFYVGYIQPANSGSDSLYIGLDANRIGGNHVYYNVLNTWESSLLGGALMIRPLLGGPIIGTHIDLLDNAADTWSAYPNPAMDVLYVQDKNHSAGTTYSITDIAGKQVLSGALSSSPISIDRLAAGMYLIRLHKEGRWSIPKKIIKQ